MNLLRVLERHNFLLGCRCICLPVAFLCYVFSCLLVLLLYFPPRYKVQGDGQFALNFSLIQSIGRGDMHTTQPKHLVYQRCMFLQDGEGFSKG